MMSRLLRIFLAFMAACFAAAVVQVFSAFTPLQIATEAEGLSLLGILLIVPKAMVQTALFSTPFVLVAAAVAEWQGIQDWIYYTLVGIAIALAGFMTLHMGEGADRTLLHDFALRAFLITGAIAGLVYWMVGGRLSGASTGDADDTISSQAGLAQSQSTAQKLSENGAPKREAKGASRSDVRQAPTDGGASPTTPPVRKTS